MKKFNAEQHEALQLEVDNKRRQYNAALNDEELSRHEFIDNFIKEAAERNISVYLDARLPIRHPTTGEKELIAIQFNNDATVIITEDEHGIGTKESFEEYSRVNRMRTYNFMKFISYTNTGENLKIKDMFQVFVGFVINVCKRYETVIDDEE